ncbi:hypothetical protein CU097_002057, partial [Rhizopus azygosporus]
QCFLSKPDNVKQSMQLSPERRSVIWCGTMVHMDDVIDKLRGITLVDEQARAEKKLIVGICDMFLGYDVMFLPGEIELAAMTTQLSQQGLKDGRLRYYADGIMIANSHEFLLTEVSSGYNSADNSKVNVWNAGNA